MGELSEKAFPFDSEKDNLGNNDREYFADDFARYFRSFISSGTFMRKADNLQIMANDDMTVTLRPGSMIIDGYKYDNVSDIIIPIEPADGVMNRIDRIAITWIKEERDIHVTIQKGQYSYTPIVPECRRTEEYKDYVVADIYIAAGAISITQDNITDQRLNTEVCGLAIAFCMIDTKMIFDQLQAFYQKVVAESNEWKEAKKVAWETWFANIKDQLSGDVAGNLQGQIGVLENLETKAKGNLVEAINEAVNSVPEIDTLDTLEEIEANTNEGQIAGALAVKELLMNYLVAEDGTRFRYGVTTDGKPGYIITDEDGADAVIPFNYKKNDFEIVDSNTYIFSQTYKQVKAISLYYSGESDAGITYIGNGSIAYQYNTLRGYGSVKYISNVSVGDKIIFSGNHYSFLNYVYMSND